MARTAPNVYFQEHDSIATTAAGEEHKHDSHSSSTGLTSAWLLRQKKVRFQRDSIHGLRDAACVALVKKHILRSHRYSSTRGHVPYVDITTPNPFRPEPSSSCCFARSTRSRERAGGRSACSPCSAESRATSAPSCAGSPYSCVRHPFEEEPRTMFAETGRNEGLLIKIAARRADMQWSTRAERHHRCPT